jgi:Zn finger protein HypA/HybF involved in hydrogenase expression
MERERIIRNSARCLNCGGEVESRHHHDFVPCPCGNVAVDGGKDYLRRVFSGAYEETSITTMEDVDE